MKTKLLFAILTLICLFGISCNEAELDMKNLKVDQFVEIIKGGHYFDKFGYELPDFKDNDIEKLLLYSKDTSIVIQFPTNPISSKYTSPKILCECILWTIDGIRFRNKYPSLEPCLIDTTSNTGFREHTRLTGKKLIEVSNLYINWYNEYTKNPSETLRKNELFKDTPYQWD